MEQVRKVRCTVVGDDSDGSGSVDDFVAQEGRPLLDAVRNHVAAPIQVGCRGGGCGVCRVQVLEGSFTAARMSRRFVTEQDAADGYALSCKLMPTSDLVVRWAPAFAPGERPRNPNLPR